MGGRAAGHVHVIIGNDAERRQAHVILILSSVCPQAAALDPATPPQPDLLAAAAAFLPPPRHGDSLLRPADKFPLPHGAAAAGPGAPRPPVCGWMVDHIAQREPGAERSLMHR